MSEEGLELGGRSARNAVQEAGFDEDLKRELEERIAGAGFRSAHPSAFAQVEMPSSAGRQTRDIAAAAPWSGTESVEDASLRMLNDAYKPMRSSRAAAKPPPIRGPPSRVDTGRSRTKSSSGVRLANARDRTSSYAHMKDLPDDEREKLRKEMKERFTPSARSLPMSIKGLESLANERIEDAISRGQFRNLPRGKKIERDHNASSPFIDSTEYLLNRMIQRQDIVPPWIEKQQEVVSTATRFRGRLRADWRRHVARTISSKGGSLESRMLLADQYAVAEAFYNPSQKKKTAESFSVVKEDGHLSQITLAGESTLANEGAGHTQQITVTEQYITASGKPLEPPSGLKIQVESSTPANAILTASPPKPTMAPFRDPAWLETERSYHRLAVENLNTLTRSYNLMCPAPAQRPYFSLERELNSCYADVAPLIANEIKERASAPRVKVDSFGQSPAGMLQRFAGEGHQSKVYDEQRPRFGFRELLKEWFSKKQ